MVYAVARAPARRKEKFERERKRERWRNSWSTRLERIVDGATELEEEQEEG